MLYYLGKAYIWLLGWQPEGQRPEYDKFVLIAAPHTSNWDLPLLLALSWVFHLRLNWIGKHTLFRWPFGRLMRLLGGVSVDRRSAQNTVEQMAAEFAKRKRLMLTVPAEGTRGRAPYWKSGFYYIALAAGVPLVLGHLDYKHKRGGFGPSFMPSGDIDADFERIREYYQGFVAKYPECFGPVRLRPRDESSETDAPVVP